METLPVTYADACLYIVEKRLHEYKTTLRYDAESKVISYNGEHYMTRDAFREFMGVSMNTFDKAWSRNASGLTPGSDYLFLEKQDLAHFKRMIPKAFGNTARHLYLLTRKGATKVGAWFPSTVARKRHDEMIDSNFEREERYKKGMVAMHTLIHSGIPDEKMKALSSKIYGLSTTPEERELIADRYAQTEDGRSRLLAQENHAKKGLPMPHKDLLRDGGCFATGTRYDFSVVQDMAELDHVSRKTKYGNYRAFLPHFQSYASVSSLRLFVDKRGFQFENDESASVWDEEAEDWTEPTIQAAPDGMIDSEDVPPVDWFADETNEEEKIAEHEESLELEWL
jgi:hypothetical protein